MKKGVTIAVIVMFLLASSSIMLVKAFTYSAVQTTPSIVNQPWGFLATTDDPSVTQVRFEWFFGGPFGTKIGESIDTVAPFEVSIVPDKPGDWYMLISFLNANGNILHTESHLENFPPDFVVPEFPLLGAAGAIIAMLLGFAYFKKRK
jgi:hypothetical protein